MSVVVGASLEFGCFLAGVAISAQGSAITEQVRCNMTSRDVIQSTSVNSASVNSYIKRL